MLSLSCGGQVWPVWQHTKYYFLNKNLQNKTIYGADGTSTPYFSSIYEHIKYHKMDYYPYKVVIVTCLMRLKPIFSMNHLVQASYDPSINQSYWDKIQLIPFSFLSWSFFPYLDFSLCPSTGHLYNLWLISFWVMDQ